MQQLDTKQTARSILVVERGTQRRTSLPHTISLHTTRQRIVLAALTCVWLLCLIHFWTWWLGPEHENDWLRLLINSLILFWTTVVPGYFVFFLWFARIADPKLPIPGGWRVAMVVTKAPPEPFDVVRRTLIAMLSQPYPHDTWLADEKPDAETLAWCATHGVKVSTRDGCAAYHRSTWPRRTRCKEGNLAFFYDHYGYAQYDFVVQLDADHVPTQAYLENMLRPFTDQAVGYVSAPSICDNNAATSWAARGRLFAESLLHGALQAGHSGGGAPLCIGSHYAVRTRALQEIGGIGPELAEDHSTTLLMNAHGWRGVHALNAIAHGDGPQNFADLATQEFQWSRSLVMILLRYTPRYLHLLPPRLKAQFLFAQFWYPLFATMMLLMYLLPLLALLEGRSWVNVIYLDFLLHAAPLTTSLILIVAFVRRNRWCRPEDAPALSWEDFVFLFARWPWALLGTGAAILGWLGGKEFEFRVTPKGHAAAPAQSWSLLSPYALLSLVSSLTVIFTSDPGAAAGFYLFAIMNATIHALVLSVIVLKHERSTGPSA